MPSRWFYEDIVLTRVIFQELHTSSQGISQNGESSSFSISLSDETAPVGEEGIDSIDSALRKREYVMKELVDTEEKYVADLKMVCEGYLFHMRDPNCSVVMPEPLRQGKDKMVFGNIEAIYEWHRELVLCSIIIHYYLFFILQYNIIISRSFQFIIYLIPYECFVPICF